MGMGHYCGIGNDMTRIVAIETATDACSVAVYMDGQIRESYAIAPRQHSQLIFTMLEELLPGGNLADLGIQAIAYGCGPGSFTGLRIAASVVQGLTYSCNLPAIALSTLTVLAQSAWRCGVAGAGDTVLCTIDARINEVYSAIYAYEDNLAVLREGPWACAPADLSPSESGSLCAVGSGCHFLDDFPFGLRARITSYTPDLLPAARDMIPLALTKFGCVELQTPRQVQPVYVRDEISWKKLHEQGRYR
jgi:tRNA threonylcarbamoyladenosine biosynthesis protein TsaB